MAGHSRPVMVVAAMAPELAPLLERTENLRGPEQVGHAEFWTGRLEGAEVVLVRSGIGLVNAASAMTAAAVLHRPRRVVSVGSAGGIRGRVRIGEVVVGTSFTYSTANAVEFGYQLGQVPGMPVRFEADASLVARFAGAPGVVTGPIASGDVFVAGDLLDGVLRDFGDIVAVDMESTALAQVCRGFGVPFASVRGISDLCGPQAGEQHSVTVVDVSAASADALRVVLGH